MNDLTDEKIKVNDVSTGFASETFIVVLSSRSKAATGIIADRKNYLTNNRFCPPSRVYSQKKREFLVLSIPEAR
jgi:hypothetical protein